MSFLSISVLLHTFPEPSRTPIRDIRDRFGVCYATASQARALAIDYLEVRTLAQTLGVSQAEAEEWMATRRKPSGPYGRRAGHEERARCR